MKPEMDDLNVPILPEHQPSSSSTLTTAKSKLTKRIIMPTIASAAGVLGIAAYFFYLFSVPVGLYSVVIDAGSSGSRVHVFRYSNDQSGKPVFNFGNDHYAWFNNTDGLSTYADNLDLARAKVNELVQFAKTIVPAGLRSISDIRLMATAGMRSLQKPEQDRILDAIKEVLRTSTSGFKFQDDWASIISGSDEGIYAWVIANHAHGTLGSDPSQTTGIVELGGASGQVTFVSNDDEHVSDEDLRVKFYGNVRYTIYSHSFDGYGKDAALKKLSVKLQSSATGEDMVEDPCTPKGYIYNLHSQKYLSVFLADESEYKNLEAAGNFAQCKLKTLEILQAGNDSCPRNDQCAIGSTYTPHDEQASFLATANFFFTGKFFSLNLEVDWLSQLAQKGQAFCGKTWTELITQYEEPKYKKEYLRGYCFSSAYIISMLERLRIDYTRIKYANNENDIPLDWALGAFIDTATQPITLAPAPAPTPTLTSGVGANSRKIFGF